MSEKKKVHEDQLELGLFAPMDKMNGSGKHLRAVREEIVDLVAKLILDWAKRQREKTARQGGRDD